MPTRLLDPTAVQAQLRRMARSGEAPWLHAEVARRMAEKLAIVRLRPKRIVEWWGGPGGGGELLARAYPDAERLVVEPDARWAARSAAVVRRGWLRRWTGPSTEVVAEAQAGGRLRGDAELLWSNMALHAALDPPALIAGWHAALAVDGFAMFSCLGPDTLGELRGVYRDAGWPPPTIDFVDMHDLGDMLMRAGFADPVMDQETLTLTWPDAAALLAELRTLGGNASPARLQGLRTPRWKARLMAAIEARRGADGRIAMRFEIVYGHAFKPAPRPASARETTVSIDAMRELVRARRPRP